MLGRNTSTRNTETLAQKGKVFHPVRSTTKVEGERRAFGNDDGRKSNSPPHLSLLLLLFAKEGGGGPLGPPPPSVGGRGDGAGWVRSPPLLSGFGEVKVTLPPHLSTGTAGRAREKNGPRDADSDFFCSERPLEV